MLRPCSLQLRRRQLLFSSPLLFQHHSFKDSTTLSKTHLPADLHPFGSYICPQSFHRGFNQRKWKEVTFSKSGYSSRRKNLQSNWVYCKYSLVRHAFYINGRKLYFTRYMRGTSRNLSCSNMLNLAERKDLQLPPETISVCDISVLQPVSYMWNLNVCCVDCVI